MSPGMPRPGIPLGRIGPVPVYLRPAWFLVAAVITVLFAPTVRASVTVDPGLEYLIALGFAVLLLFSVLVHELAHAAAAAATGHPARHIVLDVWGGHTAFGDDGDDGDDRADREPPGPWSEIVVAVAGPLSNAVLALLAGLALRSGPSGGVPRVLLVATETANLVVAAFNALPGLPLDGGRVVEALVWRVTGDRLRGTVVAGWSGRVVAAAVAGWALLELAGGYAWTDAVWLLLVAGLLWRGAGQAIAAAGWYRRAGATRIDELLQPAVSVPSTATVATALLTAAAAGARAVVVLDVYGRPASIVDEREAAEVPAARAGLVRASVVAHPLPEGAVLTAGLEGDPLLERLRAVPADRYAVLDSAERVIGVLDLEDVARRLE